ncbi:MAG: type II toxin-antitoxin system HigB family toxin [Cyanobacteria bacterium SZAS LIN-3]|nr:type II toxin-antitoxin system HigB family toxin [Cyanobacteria bacterium SZAS LIN-3]
MRIVGTEIIHTFALKHARERAALKSWAERTESINWNNRTELQKTHPSADFHAKKNRYIFDIGSQSRLIAQINFQAHLVIVCEILKHDEYKLWSRRI